MPLSFTLSADERSRSHSHTSHFLPISPLLLKGPSSPSTLSHTSTTRLQRYKQRQIACFAASSPSSTSLAAPRASTGRSRSTSGTKLPTPTTAATAKPSGWRRTERRYARTRGLCASDRAMAETAIGTAFAAKVESTLTTASTMNRKGWASKLLKVQPI
eukprot:1650344-Pleurochrysis_carterae.AAC.3